MQKESFIKKNIGIILFPIFIAAVLLVFAYIRINTLDLYFKCNLNIRLNNEKKVIKFSRESFGNNPLIIESIDDQVMKEIVYNIYRSDFYSPFENLNYPSWNIRKDVGTHIFYRDTVVWNVAFAFRQDGKRIVSLSHEITDCGKIYSTD